MCEQGNIKTLIIKDKLIDIDSCILPMVKMFNENGYETIASCCGHGKVPGNIALADGRFIDIHQNRESWRRKTERLEKIEGLMRDFLAEIHEDIFIKLPRGQVTINQDIRLTRATKLLSIADELRDLLEE